MTKTLKKSSKFWVLFCFLLTMAITISLADFCSNIITIKAFSTSNSFRGQAEYNIFAISLFSSSNKATALAEASSQQKQSGAGFVWEHNGKFCVIASAYAEENDAKLVASNLEKENKIPEIIKIHIKKTAISGSHSQEEQNALTSALTIYKSVFDNLYDISIALDTNINTTAESLLFIADIENLVSKTKLNFDALFSSNLSSEILYIKLSLNDLASKMSDLKNHPQNTTSNQTFSSKIKQTYMDTIILNFELCKKI